VELKQSARPPLQRSSLPAQKGTKRPPSLVRGARSRARVRRKQGTSDDNQWEQNSQSDEDDDGDDDLVDEGKGETKKKSGEKEKKGETKEPKKRLAWNYKYDAMAKHHTHSWAVMAGEMAALYAGTPVTNPKHPHWRLGYHSQSELPTVIPHMDMIW
jgi:hypothetical protein